MCVFDNTPKEISIFFVYTMMIVYQRMNVKRWILLKDALNDEAKKDA